MCPPSLFQIQRMRHLIKWDIAYPVVLAVRYNEGNRSIAFGANGQFSVHANRCFISVREHDVEADDIHMLESVFGLVIDFAVRKRWSPMHGSMLSKEVHLKVMNLSVLRRGNTPESRPSSVSLIFTFSSLYPVGRFCL